MKKILHLIALVSFGASATAPDLFAVAQKKNITLTRKEKRVARIGKISSGRQVSGGLLGTYPGFGLGHVAQNRWKDDGKFFTYGQLGAVALMAVSGSCVGELFDKNDNDCGGPQEVLLLTGLVGYIGLRIWEIVDVWQAPARQNRRFEFLRNRLESTPDPLVEGREPLEPQASLQLAPILGPSRAPGVGLTLTY